MAASLVTSPSATGGRVNRCHDDGDVGLRYTAGRRVNDSSARGFRKSNNNSNNNNNNNSNSKSDNKRYQLAFFGGQRVVLRLHRLLQLVDAQLQFALAADQFVAFSRWLILLLLLLLLLRLLRLW